MNATAESITLLVDKNKIQAFMEMLKLFDFVEVESLENKIARYVTNAPDNVPLSEEDIMDIVKANRSNRKNG